MLLDFLDRLLDCWDRIDWRAVQARAIASGIGIVVILVVANSCGSDDAPSSEPAPAATAGGAFEPAAESTPSLAPTPEPKPEHQTEPTLGRSYPVTLTVDEDDLQFGTNKDVNDEQGLVGEWYDRELTFTGACQTKGATCVVESLPFSLYSAKEKGVTTWKVKSVTHDKLVLTYKETFPEDCVWTRRGKPIGTFTTTATGRLTFSEPEETENGRFVWWGVDMVYKEHASPDNGSDPACTDKRYEASGWGAID
jgi:hypothetical protein